MNEKFRELFKGSDIRKAFPANEYHIEPSVALILPNELYCIEEYKYQTNTITFMLTRIWEPEKEN